MHANKTKQGFVKNHTYRYASDRCFQRANPPLVGHMVEPYAESRSTLQVDRSATGGAGGFAVAGKLARDVEDVHSVR